MTKEIQLHPLSSGKTALVDDHDYAWLMQWRWRYLGSDGGYAHRFEHNSSIYMHRQILNAPSGTEVDHRDRDGLNNQRSNLRLASRADNARNLGKPQTGRATSQYKGVSWNNKDRRWKAQITVNLKNIYLGNFTNEVDAAKAYDDAALLHFGEFAYLNNPASLDAELTEAQ